MSQGPLRKCSHPGCRQLVRSPANRCEAHAKQNQREADRRRGSARERGYSSRWDRYSKWFLSQPDNALCVECFKHGKVKASECTDHIVPAEPDSEVFWDSDNHQALCIPCNSRKGNRPAP